MIKAMPKSAANDFATKADLADLVTTQKLKAELAELKADFAFRLYGALMAQMAVTLGAVCFTHMR